MLDVLTVIIRKRVKEMSKLYLHEKVKCACQGCTKRYPLCHSQCEDYKLYRDTLSKLAKKEQEEKLCKGDNLTRNYAHKENKR